RLRFAVDGTCREPWAEVPGELDLSTGYHPERRAGLHPPDPAVQRLGLRHVLQHHVVLDRPADNLFGDAEYAGQLQQTLFLAGERDTARAGRVEQRLDTEHVARAEDDLLLRVPDHEGEHAAQLLDGVGTELVVGGDDRLAVALRGEPRAEPAAEFSTQFEVVVDLAVEVDRVARGRLRRPPDQRLVGVLQVDEAEAVEAEDDLRVGPGVGLVRAAVALAVQRGRDGAAGGGRLGLGGTDQSKHTAHIFTPRDPGWERS